MVRYGLANLVRGVKALQTRKKSANGLENLLLQGLASHNRRQNELRHFSQNWAFLRFINLKRRKYSFPPPSPPCNVVPLF